MRTLRVWVCAVLLAAALVCTVLDWVTNHDEPKHVLILSWLALDIALAQLLQAALTHREIKDGEGR